jgi:hypothetical protein
MVNERTDVKHPLWRKKVDGSIFTEKCTLIPEWVKDSVFGIREVFPHRSRKNPLSQIKIRYNHPSGKNTIHTGWITTTYFSTRKDVQRLYFDEDILQYLQRDFVMTYHRTQEKIFRGVNSPAIEKEIQFWEFLDIEYNQTEMVLLFTPYYNLKERILPEFTYLL